MKKISILGSTGSVGSQIVGVVSHFKDVVEVDALSCHSNYLLLLQQVRTLSPDRVFISDEASYGKLKNELSSQPVEVILERESDVGAILSDNDMILVGISGIDALRPVYSAVSRGVTVATSNKESLVCGGELLKPYLDRILPLDSEHYAIAKLLHSRLPGSVSGITITASGGPFFKKEKRDVTVADALNHPIWKMGKKNSIDSATMMNKVLEVIEAHYLFRIPREKISILIHPEALVHGMIDFFDGSQHAFMSVPDMRVGINDALTRLTGSSPRGICGHGRLSLAMKKLTFYPPEEEEFGVLKFINTDQEIALNAINDLAVEDFLDGKIAFCDITEFISLGMEKFHYDRASIRSVGDVLSVYHEARRFFKDRRTAVPRKYCAIN